MHVIWKIGLPVVAFLFVTCAGSQNETANAEVQHDQAAPSHIDSVAWYDSAYTPVRTDIEAFFDSLHHVKQFNGGYLVVYKGHELARGYHGLSRKEENVANSRNTAFQIASMSKTMTAMCILKLVEQGKLTLQTKVDEVLKGFPYPDITVAHLLAHRGGLGNYMYFMEKDWKDAGKAPSNKDLLAFMMKDQPKRFFAPDYKFDYSNTGYGILVCIIEEITGKPYSEIIQEYIFDKSGMGSAFLINPDTLPAHGAYGYESNGYKAGNAWIGGIYGDKGVYATLDDLHGFAHAYLTGALLPDSLNTILAKPANDIDKDTTTYGYGFRLVYPNGEGGKSPIVHHTGWFAGFRGNLIMVPSKDLIIIWNTNMVQGSFFSPKLMTEMVYRAFQKSGMTY